MAIGWRYYEYDGAYFRGRAEAAGVDDVWDPNQQKWLPYTGKDRVKQTSFGSAVTREEAESQHYENGRLLAGKLERK